MNLEKDSINKLFWHYTLPSIAMTLVMSLYFIIDGIFVSNGVSESALGAVNISMPFMMVMNMLIVAISAGSGILISVKLGQKNTEDANKIFSLLMIINITLGIIGTILGKIFLDKIILLLGASGELIGLTEQFLSVMMSFILFFILSGSLSTVVRNDGNPKLSMAASIIGTIFNITGDIVFIFILDLGIFGGALATGLSQFVSFGILIFHFILKKGQLRLTKPVFDLNIIKSIFKNGLPVLATNISVPLVLIAVNILAMKYYGETGVSAYAIAGGIYTFIGMTFVGISQGIQPIISYNYGQKARNRLLETIKIALSYTVLIGILVAITIYFAFDKIVLLYTDQTDLIVLAKHIVTILLITVIFRGLNMVSLSILQSVQKTKKAFIIGLLRSFVFLGSMTILMPLIFGKEGIWFVLPGMEILSTLVIFFSFGGFNFFKKLKIDKNIKLES